MNTYRTWSAPSIEALIPQITRWYAEHGVHVRATIDETTPATARITLKSDDEIAHVIAYAQAPAAEDLRAAYGPGPHISKMLKSAAASLRSQGRDQWSISIYQSDWQPDVSTPRLNRMVRL